MNTVSGILSTGSQLQVEYTRFYCPKVGKKHLSEAMPSKLACLKTVCLGEFSYIYPPESVSELLNKLLLLLLLLLYVIVSSKQQFNQNIIQIGQCDKAINAQHSIPVLCSVTLGILSHRLLLNRETTRSDT